MHMFIMILSSCGVIILSFCRPLAIFFLLCAGLKNLPVSFNMFETYKTQYLQELVGSFQVEVVVLRNFQPRYSLTTHKNIFPAIR